MILHQFRGKAIASIEELDKLGIDHENGWVYGNLINGDVPIIAEDYVDTEGEMIQFGQYTPVHPESVGQYTGVQDKNGCEIYEGDIVKFTKNVRIGTNRRRRGRSRTYDSFGVYADRDIIAIVEYGVFGNEMALITKTNASTTYDSYFFGEGKRSDRPDLYTQGLTDRLMLNIDYEIIGNTFDNPELVEADDESNL